MPWDVRRTGGQGLHRPGHEHSHRRPAPAPASDLRYVYVNKTLARMKGLPAADHAGPHPHGGHSRHRRPRRPAATRPHRRPTRQITTHSHTRGAPSSRRRFQHGCYHRLHPMDGYAGRPRWRSRPTRGSGPWQTLARTAHRPRPLSGAPARPPRGAGAPREPRPDRRPPIPLRAHLAPGTEDDIAVLATHLPPDPPTGTRSANHQAAVTSLVAATARTNHSKTDQESREWMPPLPNFHCRSVSEPIATKFH